jgi:hypothetical protein
MHIASMFRSPHDSNNHQTVLNEDFPRFAYLFPDQPLIDVQLCIA